MRVEKGVPRFYDDLPDVRFTELAVFESAGRTRVDLAVLPAGASLPRHPAGAAQTFYVVEGRGRVAGSDDAEVTVDPGDAVTWEPGEVHTSWADTPMTVVIIQSSTA